MKFKSAIWYAPYMVVSALFVWGFHAVLAHSLTAPIAVNLIIFYAVGQILSMAAFWSLDYLSNKPKYEHLRAFFSAPDKLSFARSSDRVGNIVAFFGSWLYLVFVALVLLKKKDQDRNWQNFYQRAHVELWKFFACTAPLASLSCVYMIIQ